MSPLGAKTSSEGFILVDTVSDCWLDYELMVRIKHVASVLLAYHIPIMALSLSLISLSYH